jgi:hypothetical protein
LTVVPVREARPRADQAPEYGGFRNRRRAATVSNGCATVSLFDAKTTVYMTAAGASRFQGIRPQSVYMRTSLRGRFLYLAVFMRVTILVITCIGSAELNALQLIVVAFPPCALLCFHSGRTYSEKNNLGGGKEMRGVTRYCKPFVEHDPQLARATVPLAERVYDYTLLHPSAVGMGEHSGTRERSTTFARLFRQ